MKIKTIFMGIFTSIIGLFSCKAQTEEFKSLEVAEFEKAIADTNVVRLDVRTPEEYIDGHIDGAANIDVLSEDFEEKACAELPKDKTIALYCRSGRRSKKAAGILAKHGYKIIELNTGYLGWTGAGKDVVKGNMTGAYTDHRSLEPSEKELFEAAYKGDIKLTPLKVATQVVAGTNYSFICKDSDNNIFEVVIFEPLPGRGNPEMTSVTKK